MMTDVRRAVAQYLAQCFTAGRSPQVAELARWLRIKPAVLSRLFRRATGRKLGPLLHEQQVLRARRLLRWSSAAAAEVARWSGYETERSFYRAFRRSTGMTPRRFRERAAATSPRSWGCGVADFPLARIN